jgi:hypothetical protein
MLDQILAMKGEDGSPLRKGQIMMEATNLSYV